MQDRTIVVMATKGIAVSSKTKKLPNTIPETAKSQSESNTELDLQTRRRSSSAATINAQVHPVSNAYVNNTTIVIAPTPTSSPTFSTKANALAIEPDSPSTDTIAHANEDPRDVSAQTPSSTMAQFKRWESKFKDFHFKNRGDIDKDLVLFRTLSIIGLIAYSIIDTLMYTSTANEISELLQFIHGSRYIEVEVFTTVYASGVAAFGASIEMYILLPHAIINCILISVNCHSKATLDTAIIWVVKLTFVFAAVEITYRNFRKYYDYDGVIENRSKKFNKTARSIQRQALIFSVSMLFLSASGLKALQSGVHTSLPLFCPYDTSHCGIVELYEPLFSYENDKCQDDLTGYIASREQLRVLRNYLFLNGISYAVFNCNILNIEHRSSFSYLRIPLTLLYVGLATSVLFAYIDPFYFIKNDRFPFNIVELVLFIILFLLPAVNLWRLRGRKLPQEIIICDHTDILPRP